MVTPYEIVREAIVLNYPVIANDADGYSIAADNILIALAGAGYNLVQRPAERGERHENVAARSPQGARNQVGRSVGDTGDSGRNLERTMHDKEAIQMMQRCKEEIRLLRIEIERLKPKAEAYESIAHVLSLLPRPSIGMGEDMVWTLEKRIREIESNLASEVKQ